MTIGRPTTVMSGYFRDLRSTSLRTILLFTGACSYVWLILVLWPVTGGAATLAEWVGSGLLVLCVILAYALRRRALRWACYLLVGSVLIAIICAMRAFNLFDVAYLFALPVAFASVLLGPLATVVTAMTALIAIGSAGVSSLGLSPFSARALLPMATTAVTAGASLLSERNLYTALGWAWNGYERARQNEQLARRRRGELSQSLKALDEATYRLARSRDELLVARQQAEEARALKEQFVATVSHELRTPLNLIVGFAEMMYLAPESYPGVGWTPELEGDIREMYRASRHLQSLVNDILDLARIDASRLPMFRELVDLRATIAEALETISPLMRQRGLFCRRQWPKTLPQLLIDRMRIRQVMINLLNNAVRFTDEGGITVRIEQTEDAVVVSVRDTGVGIPEDQLEHVFEEFRQVDGGTSRRGGVGLGLALSRQFVALHGGSLWAESKLGEGSTFYFSLPLPGAVSAGKLRRAPDRQRGDLSRPPVIVVDPDPTIGEMLSRYLGDHPVLSAESLAEAEALIEAEHPLAIIVNHSPDVPIDAWLGTLGEDSQRYGVPIFRCSIPSPGWLRQSSALDDCLTKPVTRESIRRVLEKYCPEPSRVLVVDDDPGFVRLMTRMLGTMELAKEVLPAYTGPQALRLALENVPRLVLLDLLMPEMDGFEVLAAMRAEPALRETSIVAVTATSYPEDALGRREGRFTLTQSMGMSAGTVTDLLSAALQIVRPNYVAEQAT